MGIALSKASIAFRIGTTQWMPEVRFRELIDLFDRYSGVTDEVTFFTSETHAPLPLQVMVERCELLSRRMADLKGRGYRTGINILATIGHHNENLPNSLSSASRRMTDIDGNTCLGSFCPNDPVHRGYVTEVYTAIASAQPDYIWIDDDVRFGHVPIRPGCFCDICLSLFADETGVRHTRESLKVAFDAGGLDDRLSIRRAWLQHNRSTIARLFELIETTVHGLKPGLPLGFMTGDRFFEGYDFAGWTKVLSGPECAEVIWRPGGGFYRDDRLSELAGKSHDIGRQVSLLPETVVKVQSEIENFPYQRLQKSARATSLEAASHIAAGCTGAAFNVLSMYDEPLSEYEPLVAALRDSRPFLDLLVRQIGRSAPAGLYTGWSIDTSSAAGLAQGDNWFDADVMHMAGAHANEMLEVGIPAAYSPSLACVTTLSGDSALALGEVDLLSMFSGGVYMDVAALRCVNAMGYSDLTGFAPGPAEAADCIEELVAHELNGPFAGRRRDCRQSFPWWSVPVAGVIPTDNGAQVMTRLVDYGDKERAACVMGVFENRLQGRVCVSGYYPWSFLHNLSKSSQVKTLMRWLSRDSLPGYVSSFHKANVWIRRLPWGGRVAVLTNSCLDKADGLTLTLQTAAEEVQVFDMNGATWRVPAARADGRYRSFVLPPIGAWEMVLVVAEGSQ